MAQPRGVFVRRVAPRLRPHAGLQKAIATPRRVLCVLPRKHRANPLQPLLAGYELSVAHSLTGTLRLARQSAFDLIVIYGPLGRTDVAAFCAKLQALDPHTPLIVYSIVPSVAERRDVRAAGAHAYVCRADDAQNLGATAGQHIMLAELRSMEALARAATALEDDLVRRLKKLGKDTLSLPARAQRLKRQVGRLFLDAGGNRANFERAWPSLYEAALRRLRRETSA